MLPPTAAPTRTAVTVDQGTIAYSECGPAEAPALVFVHGAFVDGTLWRKVVPELEGSFRCVVPDLPLGSHHTPMRSDADLSPPGLANLIADFIAALELEDVTLIGNDTGGALCQLVVTRRPERIGRLVLTPCDAYENFLPPAFRYLQAIARVPGGIALVANSMRIPASRRSPLAFGWLSKRPIPGDVLAAWTKPIIANTEIRRDARAVLRGISKRYTIEAAAKLRRVRAARRCSPGRPRTASSSRSSPSASPLTSPAHGSSGSRTRGRSSPRISRSAWRR